MILEILQFYRIVRVCTTYIILNEFSHFVTAWYLMTPSKALWWHVESGTTSTGFRIATSDLIEADPS